MNELQKHQIALLLDLLDQAFRRQTWHGPNLRGSLRGIIAAQAAMKPRGANNTIWQIAVHCTYWKYAVWRRLTGAKMGSFPKKGSDWFGMPADRTEKAWKAELKLLSDYHKLLVQAVSHYDPGTSPMSWGRALHNVVGIANHDLYHAGQIQLIKSQLGLKRRSK